MIVIDLSLWSARTGNVSNMGLLTISNIKQYRDGRYTYADYRVRAYKKGTSTTTASLHSSRPIREGVVLRHPKHAKPAWSLVLKALQELGYDQ